MTPTVCLGNTVAAFCPPCPQLRIEQLCDQFAGSLRLGLTCFSPNNVGCMPSSLDQIPDQSWWIEGKHHSRHCIGYPEVVSGITQLTHRGAVL